VAPAPVAEAAAATAAPEPAEQGTTAVLGEFELIQRIRETVAAAGGPPSRTVALGSGDDAALTTPPGTTVTTVDAVVEGVHFLRDLFPPAAIGHKALAAALSDLAAMGAEAGEAYIQLGLPVDLDDAATLELADGLGRAAATWGVAIAGGDVTRAPVLFLAVTAVGHLGTAEEAVTRAGARPGDRLVVTGELGGAAAGLVVLRDPAAADGIDLAVVEDLRRRQLEPQPRLAAGRALAAAGATAMIDVSDGLGGDAGHLAAASGVGIIVEAQGVPIQAGVAELAAATGADAIELALSGGEDYELLAALPEEAVAEATASVAATGVELTPIGVIEAGAASVEFRDPDGRERPPVGYDQLRPQGPGEDG
jgi:thiamine-monophosphate kinase